MNDSVLFGWIYVIAWSVSFYPPIILNYKLKSTRGISADFVCLNNFGYMCLMIALYIQVFIERTGSLTYIDFTYAAHGYVLNLVMLSQVFLPRLWGFDERRTMSHLYHRLLIGSICLCITLCLLYPVHLTTILTCFKIGMSLIKYIPQVRHNYKRRSVQGFSVTTVGLDLTGSVFSLLQLYVDNDLRINGKLGISMVTMVFDVIFVTQWALYE